VGDVVRRQREPGVTNARADALDEFAVEHANLAAALEWAAAGERAEAPALIAAMAFYWAQRGHYAEASAWEARVLGNTSAADGATVARARWRCAYVWFYGGDAAGAYERAMVALEEKWAALEIARLLECTFGKRATSWGQEQSQLRTGHHRYGLSPTGTRGALRWGFWDRFHGCMGGSGGGGWAVGDADVPLHRHRGVNTPLGARPSADARRAQAP
jgi:hypothetical protein